MGFRVPVPLVSALLVALRFPPCWRPSGAAHRPAAGRIRQWSGNGKGQAVACPASCALGPAGPKLVNGGTADPYRLNRKISLPSGDN